VNGVKGSARDRTIIGVTAGGGPPVVASADPHRRVVGERRKRHLEKQPTDVGGPIQLSADVGSSALGPECSIAARGLAWRRSVG